MSQFSNKPNNKSTRRSVIFLAGISVLPLPRRTSTAAILAPDLHKITLSNTHTGESFDGVYRNGSGPLAEAMAELSYLLRDFRSSATIAIDVRLIDFLAAIIGAIGARVANILSGYRTLETNVMLAHTEFGVAENSQHLYGRALDVNFGEKLTDAVRAARAMKRGGVGWYPQSGFMHIDTGPVRNWDLDGRYVGHLAPNSRPMRDASSMRSRRGLLPVLERSGLLSPELERSGRLQSSVRNLSRLSTLPK